MASQRLPLLLPFRLIPGPAQAGMLTFIVNHMLRGQTWRARLQALDGKSVSIHIVDIPWQMHFRIRYARIRATTNLPTRRSRRVEPNRLPSSGISELAGFSNSKAGPPLRSVR